MNTVYRDNIYFIICCCLPFLFVPKILHLNFIGGPIGTQLIIWPILLAYGYTLYCGSKKRKIFIHKKTFILFSFVYIIFNLFSLIHGLYIYPYWNLILAGPINQIEKLPAVYDFLHSHSVMIAEQTLAGIWIICRFFKTTILECVYTFGFSYMIYCWFRDAPERAMHILKQSINIIILLMCIYSFFELIYFFGYDWAKGVLITVNPVLHAIKENFGWWPPLLWDSARIRSIFPEPSYFGMYVTFIIPILCSSILDGIKLKQHLFFLFCMAVLLFLSLSKTSNILFILEMLLIFLFVIIRKNKKYLQRMFFITIICTIAFGVSMWCLSNYGQRPFSFTSHIQQTGISRKDISNEYISNNIAGVADPQAGSNSARFSIIKSDLRIFSDNVFLGVGSGLKEAYTSFYLTETEKKIPEIALCRMLQFQKGVLKSGYPTVCEFTKRLAENGIIGFLMYIGPLVVLSMICFKKRITICQKSDNLNTTVCTFVSLIICFGAGGSGILTTIHTYWLLLGISYAFALKKEN